MDLSLQELKVLIECLNTTVKVADNALQVSSVVLPIAQKVSQKIQELSEEEKKAE